MKLKLHCAHLLSVVCLLLSTITSAQSNIWGPEGVNWVGAATNWTQPTNGTPGDFRVLQYRKVSTTSGNTTDGRGQWATTINVQNSGGDVQPTNGEFLFTSGGGNQYANKWSGSTSTLIDAINSGFYQAGPNNAINMSVPGHYTFVLRDAGYTNSSFYVGYTASAPVSISHNAATQTTVANAVGTVAATLSAAPSTEEKFYVRYRTVNNDFSSTSNVVQATVSGTTITATIPAQAASTVYYYIFSSTRNLTDLQGSSAGNIALSTLRHADNDDNNYSYVVEAAPAQPGTISGNAVVCANSSQTYSVASDPFASSYIWTLPSGWSGSSATNTIDVAIGANGGTLSVVAVNNSGQSPSSALSVTINDGTTITSQPSTATQTLCLGTAGAPYSVTAEGSALTYQWYSNTTNSNVGGTLITGATSSSYSPSSSTAGTRYYYAVVGGACSPTSVTSSVSGAVTVNGLPNDNASNAAYGTFTYNGNNGGGGFMPWQVTSSGNAGSFISNSDIGTAFGLYANSGGTVSALRPFATALTLGSTVSFAFDNGGIDSGGSVGVQLRNASGETLTEFKFANGFPEYSVTDAGGTTFTGVTYTGSGLSSVTFAYTSANTYSISITKAGATTVLTGRTFSAVANGQTPSQLVFFNNNAGPGSDHDAFINNLSIGYPKIFSQPATSSQTVCQNQPAQALSVTAFGPNLTYQWYSNTTPDTVGATLISNADQATFNPSTSDLGTKYYYAVVSNSTEGSCVPSITSAISGAVNVATGTFYYADTDEDGFGDANVAQIGCNGAPTGFVGNDLDCDDSQILYADADGDGFGSMTVAACGVANNTDCNDNDATSHQTFSFYPDDDGDSFGAGELISGVCAANADTAPFGYSVNNTDCDDYNELMNSSYFFYADNDGDGFGTGELVLACAINQSTPPAGYSQNNSDCNDENSNMHATYPFYVDSDADGFGTGSIQIVCAVNGSTPPAGYSMNNTDCNDSDASMHASYYFFTDSDNDGYGTGSPILLCAVNASTPPAGYIVNNNSDCNDNDPMMHQLYPFYVDADGDGYGVGFPTGVCAVNSTSPPAGYAMNNSDCNDNNASVNGIYYFYADNDGDGFGAGGLAAACALNASTPPAGFASNNTDCNDANGSAWMMGTLFVDADNDGYTSGATASVCHGTIAPSGYTFTNIGIDCNDSNPLAWTVGTLFVDSDNDGYTSGETASVCHGTTAPSGYTFNNIGIDCDDSITAINPGMPEILYNGFDDNCNGLLDEGQQLITKIQNSQCGTTLSVINAILYADNFNNMTAYRFEVTNTATNAVQVIVRPLRWFSLDMLSSYEYATTYSIRVEMQRNGVWLGYYGPACLVSSPAILSQGGSAQINETQCGITLPSISSIISSNNVNGSTGYRFRVTNLTDPSAPNQVQVIDRQLRWFTLTMLPTYTYGTTYMIEIAVKTTGAYTAFGSPCLISTPAVPSLENCELVATTAGQIISAQNRDKVTSYRFELSNQTNNVVTTIDRPVRWFSFNMIPGYVPGAQYGVRIAVMTSGVYSLYGDACLLTAPGAAKTDVKPVITEPFAAVAYPNPFADNFNIDVTTSSTEAFSIKVYDMTGRLLETRNIEATEIETQQVGDRYPSGVYNVIVSQGDQVKTVRVVKR